jgi:phosphoglycolate phosphatase
MIFDLDGTLVDSLPGIANSLNRALGISGYPGHALSAVRGFIGNGSRVLIERAVAGRAGEDEIDTLEAAFKRDYEKSWPEGTTVYPGVSELLACLAGMGHPLAVLSNKPHPFTTAIVSRVFPEIQFACVLGQRPGIAHKPDPAGALELAEAMGMPPEMLSMVGDSTIDIETARNAGMQAIAVTWGFHDRDRLLAAGAEVMVDTAGALAGWLAGSSVSAASGSPR